VRALSPDRADAAEGKLDEAGAQRVVRTGADGRFEVTLDPDDPCCTVVATAPGFGMSAEDEVRAGDDLLLTLVPSASIAGRVMDPERRPVSGAAVEVFGTYASERYSRVTVADGTGAFEVLGIPPSRPHESRFSGRGMHIEVSAEGYASTLVTLDVLRGGIPRDLEIVLRPSRRLTVTVRDATTGAPISSASVGLDRVFLMGISERRQRLRKGAGAPTAVFPETVATTDASGRCEVSGVEAEVAENDGTALTALPRICVWKPGYVSTAGIVAAPGMASMSLVLAPAARVTGRVLDGDGKPVPGARVAAVAASGPAVVGPPSPPSVLAPSTTADATGRYALDLAAGATLEIRAETGARRFPTTPEFGSVKVSVQRDGDTEAPDLILRRDARSCRAPVVVLSAEGTPLPGATVFAAMGTTRTDRNGRAVVPRDHPQSGRESPVTAMARGFVPASMPVVEGEETVLRLERGKRIEGRVLAADGTPAVGARVRAEDPSGAAVQTHYVGDLGFHPPAVDVTDERGRFRLEGLAGTVRVVAVHRRRVPVPSGTEPPTAVAPAVEAGAADVILRLPADDSAVGALVEGTVVDAETEAPVVLDYVRFRRERPGGGVESLGIAQPSGPGRFRVETVPPGRWTVKIMAPGYGFSSVEFDVPEGVASAPFRAKLSRAGSTSPR
jgi:protocatechuate 3,4-dioxygenase beta subunit